MGGLFGRVRSCCMRMVIGARAAAVLLLLLVSCRVFAWLVWGCVVVVVVKGCLLWVVSGVWGDPDVPRVLSFPWLGRCGDGR